MSIELYYLLLSAALTGLMWFPYVINRISVQGIPDAVGYPENPKPHSPWAQRLIKAHANAVENLVLFAILVLVAHVTNVTNSIMVTACIVHFWARLVHTVTYAFGVPWVRTIAFAFSYFSLIVLFWQLMVAVA